MRHNETELKMKNKILIVILVLLMISPTVAAIINYNLQQSGSADSHNTVKVTVTDPDGAAYEFTRENGEDMIKYYLDTVANAEKIGVLPSTVEVGSFYRVVLTTAVKNFGYKFYYTLDPASSFSDCYFTDDDGVAFKIAADDAKSFLDSGYSAAMFENGKAPRLTVSGLDCAPDASKWNFKNASGEFVAYDTSFDVKDEAEELTLEGGLAMSFSLQPDSLTLKVTDSDGQELYNGDYAGVSGLVITESMKVGVEAEAKWYEDAERSYNGEQKYVFTATLTAPAQFYAGTTSVQIGEFICVTGLNVGSADKVTFTSEPDIGYSPVFYKDGDAAQALIPFNWDLAAGEYVLTFSYGGSSQQINITLSARDNPFRDSTTTIAAAVVESFGSTEAKQKCESEFSEIAKLGEGTRYWDGSFLTGMGDATIVGGFGHTYKVTGTDISYRHTGVDYRAADGTAVQAVNAGKVIYAGYTDYSGYTVVIEHGYGLKSWYAHLSKTSVNVDDVVKKGDTVGEAGSSGFIAASGAHVGLTVFDVPVCQYALWDDGARKGIPVYSAPAN